MGQVTSRLCYGLDTLSCLKQVFDFEHLVFSPGKSLSKLRSSGVERVDSVDCH